MQIWIHDNKMKKIVALNNDISDMLSYTNSSWHSYLDQATSTFDFTIPKFSNGELHEDLKLINDECFVSFYVNGSYQVFYIATLQEDDFNIQLTCNNTNLEYALEYANPFNSSSAQSIQWYLEHMDLLSFAAVEIGLNEISDRKRTLTFDSQETKMNRLQSLMSKFEAEFEFKVELNRDGTYKRIVINIYQKNHIGTDRKDVVLYYSNGLKGVQVSSDKTQMFNAAVFTGKDGLSLNDVEISEKNADGIEEFYSRKGNPCLYAPLAMQRYPATMRPDGQDNWIRKDFTTEYDNVNDLKAYALRTLKQYAYPLVTYTASVQSGFVSQYTDLKLGDTIRIIDNNFVGGLALEARVSEMIISFDNPANNSFVFTNYRKIDNKPSAALQTRIEQVVERKLPYRIELATTGGVTFKNNEGETIVKPSLYKGNLPWTKDVTWSWALDSVVTVGTQYRIKAKDITDSEVLTVAAYVGNIEVATTEITLTNVNDGKKSNYYSDTFPEDNPKGTLEKGDSLILTDGDTVKQYYWNGTEWVINPIAIDVEALKKQIAEDLKDVPNREEFENKIAEELANSKAEITTQIETAKTQAESNAKEYADTINQETAKVAELANAAADEIKADLVNVKDNLTATSLVANNAQTAVDEAKQDLANVANNLNAAKQDLADSVAAVNTKVDSTKAELTQAKQDLTSQAQQLQEQASAQSELTNRVSSVEKTADGTKTTVNELTKTVAQNGKDITSVTARTKVVEDDLSGTKTTLSQVKTTADSTSQKTATLETGLNGVKADLAATTVTADTTKTNLANYQASNDKAVANLQSNIQTANGNISSLQTKVEAVPGQITSAVSAVEGKIPTNVSTRNLILKSNDFAKPHKHGGNANTTVTSTDGYFVVRSTGYTANTWGGISWNMSISEVKAGEQFSILMPVYIDSSVNLDNGWAFALKNHPSKLTAYEYSIPTNKKDQWFNVAITFKASKNVVFATYPFYVFLVKNGLVRIKPPILVRGSLIPSDYQPAFEDTESDISSLSSEIKQTADGMTLLATKTELNSAKTELQSGITTATDKANNAQSTANSNAQTISTHTTQISALNTGLQAKVSQSDFNTLSGRVTTAENNITAKANELSSKITSVEGKLPSGEMNLVEYGRPADGYSPYAGAEYTTHGFYYNGAYKMYIIRNKTTGGKYLRLNRFKVERNTDYTFYFKGFNNSDITNMYVFFLKRVNGSKNDYDSAQQLVISRKLSNSKAEDISVTFNTGNYDEGYLRFDNNGTTTAGTSADLYFGDVSVKKGKSNNGWSPSLAELASSQDLKSTQSELKQTKDGITLLATKTELNTAKNELQSGINTATNKANSNAQTISTHTTQISALNTGLNAKVSQSEFNTLSGRVTTAENNITAKANELSSKITSVEGKIPTSVGGRNILSKTNQGKTNWSWNISSGGAILEDFDTYGVNAVKMTRASDASVSWSYIQYDGLIRKLIEPDTKYTLSFDVYPTENVTFTATLMRGDAVGEYTDWAVMNTALANRWTKVFCVLTSKTTLPDDLSQVVYLQGMPTTNWNWLVIKNIKLEKGVVPSDWSPAPEDTVNQISSLSSEFKQTTDAIKASVSSLDESTVKSSSLTINADGIVMKAGKSTTDVANAIGSYFSVNQNAINLFSDKINVKGNMIVNGAITSDKIASKSINTAHLNGKIITADVISSNAVTADAIKAGAVTTDKMSANSINGDRIAAGTLDAAKIKAGSITASQIASGTITSAQIKAGTISAVNIATGTITGDNIKANSVDVTKIVGIDANYIKAKIEYAMIDWLKGKTITAYNDNMTIDLQDGRISFKDGSNAVYRQTPDGIHTGFLHFEAGSQGGIYAAFGATSTRQGINSKSSEFAGIRCYRVSANGDSHEAKIDKIEVIGDTIQFGHGYISDGAIGGGFIMQAAELGNDIYSLNRVIKSIEALWRILHDHAKNTGYRFNDSAFINALNNEYNAWHDMRNQ